MSKVLPLYTQAQLESHSSASDCWVSLYQRKIYNVSSFLDEHPGGDDLILEYAGKDITDIMLDVISHQHSESAYEIMDESYLVGYLATEEEARELLKKHNIDVKLDHDVDNNKIVDFTEFGEVPTEDLLTVSTDHNYDYKKYHFLDLSKPLLLQVLTAKWTKEFYLDQIHRPRHYGKGSAPIFGGFLEPISLTPWYVVPIVWLPVNFYFFYIGLTHNSRVLHFGLWGLGLFVWTLLEYVLHRFLFHLDYYLPDNQILFTLHFLMHGVHHYLPMDKMRLVMPPTLFVVLCLPIYKLVFAIFPYYMGCSLFAGGFLGYIMYDVTHYALHHSKLPQYFQDLKKYHLEHHYKNYELGFGVTSKFWDRVFGTLLHEDDVLEKRT